MQPWRVSIRDFFQKRTIFTNPKLLNGIVKMRTLLLHIISILGWAIHLGKCIDCWSLLCALTKIWMMKAYEHVDLSKSSYSQLFFHLLSIIGALLSLTTPTFFNLAPLQISESNAPRPFASSRFSLGGVVFACGKSVFHFRWGIPRVHRGWWNLWNLKFCSYQPSREYLPG